MFRCFQGFEDCLILDKLFEEYHSDLSKVLPAFSEVRCTDAHVICDLAMYNYVEVGIFFASMHRCKMLIDMSLVDEGFGEPEIVHLQKVSGHSSLLAAP